jgi:hypothetical protein
MSNESSVPGEDVDDGGRDGNRHIPRDPRDDEGTTADARPSSGPGNEGPDSVNGQLPGVPDSTDNVTRAPGTAAKGI